MSDTIEKYRKFKENIPNNVTLVAVSKTKPESQIVDLYNQGQRHFGENKVQDLKEKAEHLPKDIHWHMIGHLQSNKVKYIASFVSMIHSVDSLKILNTIEKEAAKCNRILDVLLQVHIAEEQTKYGFSEKELTDFLSSDSFLTYGHIRVRGLMGMATFTEDTEKIRSEFRSLKNLFDRISRLEGIDNKVFTEISMGMSNDYSLAIDQGATIIRVGSLIFGERFYH